MRHSRPAPYRTERTEEPLCAAIFRICSPILASDMSSQPSAVPVATAVLEGLMSTAFVIPGVLMNPTRPLGGSFNDVFVKFPNTDGSPNAVYCETPHVIPIRHGTANPRPNLRAGRPRENGEGASERPEYRHVCHSPGVPKLGAVFVFASKHSTPFRETGSGVGDCRRFRSGRQQPMTFPENGSHHVCMSTQSQHSVLTRLQ